MRTRLLRNRGFANCGRMNSHRAFCLGSLVLLLINTGCGAAGGQNGSSPNVTLSPGSVTTSENGQVRLQAKVTGLCSTCNPTLAWSIPGNPYNCIWAGVNMPPPAGECPNGSILPQGEDPATSLNVTYFAPGASGTFSVTVTQPVSFSQGVVGTSVITVSQ